MSTLGDVQELYGSVRSIWDKSHAHVVAHAILAALLFLLFRVSIPEIHIPKISAAQIATDEWFKLAKDTGVIYVSFVIPFVLVAVYAALLRTVGQWLISVLALLFPPDTNRNRYRLLDEWTLESLAIILKKEDFELADLQSKANELTLKYLSKKNELWENYQKSLSRLTKNSTIYLGDFLFFLAGWITLFWMFPHAVWVHDNEPRFWRVALVLLGIAWFAWFRVSRALTLMPSLHLAFVSSMIRMDSDMASALECSAENRDAVRIRLKKLLSDELERVNREPSLLRYISRRLGHSKKASEDGDGKRLFGWPFCEVYERGYQFSRKETDSQHDSEWVKHYVAYLYYKLWERVFIVTQTLLKLGRYALTGTP